MLRFMAVCIANTEGGIFMDPALMIELFGYLGSTLVVVSMLMASVVKLRVINTIGSIISATYAFIIGSFPLALMNICLIVINVYNLIRLLNTKRQFDFVRCGADDAFVRYFLKRYSRDIVKSFPSFTQETTDANVICMVCCNGDPAGIMIGREMAEGVVDVILDYAVPAYRDCSVGRFLYEKLKDEGISGLRFEEDSSDTHSDYLIKMGFAKEEGVFFRKV